MPRIRYVKIPCTVCTRPLRDDAHDENGHPFVPDKEAERRADRFIWKDRSLRALRPKGKTRGRSHL